MALASRMVKLLKPVLTAEMMTKAASVSVRFHFP
jgi:hypothetical protein